MADFTERAIKASFLKLLNEQPLNKISVRMIVEDCGINRNSFYYHYQDIPTLLETIVTGLPAGIGEPWFDSVESELAHLMFAIPACKGLEFGAGFAFASMRGS